MPTPFEEFVFGGDDASRPARLPDPAPDPTSVRGVATPEEAPDERAAVPPREVVPGAHTPPRRTPKWRKALGRAAATVAIVAAASHLASNLPSFKLPTAQRMGEQLQPSVSDARPYNAVERAFRIALEDAIEGLNSVGKRPAQAFVYHTLCTFSPDAIARTLQEMESHYYRFAVSSALADVRARCGDAAGLIRLHQELSALQYPGGGMPVEFHALRERVARTIANSPTEAARQGRWLKEAEAAKAERHARPLRAVRDLESEHRDAVRLRQIYQTELMRARETDQRQAHGFAMLMKEPVVKSMDVRANNGAQR